MSFHLPLPAPAAPGDPVEAAQFNKLRDAVLYLSAELKKCTPCDGPEIGHCRASAGFTSFVRRPRLVEPVAFDVSIIDGKLLVTPGSTALSGGGERILHPRMPTIGGVRLDAAPAPSFSLSELSPGDWEVWCRFSLETAEIFLAGPGQAMPEPLSGEHCIKFYKFTLSAENAIASASQVRNGHIELAAAAPLPFTVASTSKTGADFRAVLHPGWVCELHAKLIGTAVDPLRYFSPLIDGTAMDDLPALPLAGAASWNYLRIKTDSDGLISGTSEPDVTVESFAAAQSSVHHVPQQPGESEGTSGDYFFFLFATVADGADAVTVEYKTGDLRSVSGSHFRWNKELWRGVNLGGGADSSVFKRYNSAEDLWEFREIKGNYGLEVKEEADRLVVDQDLENVGSGRPVWVEPADPAPDETAKLRSIAPRGTGSGAIEYDDDDAGVTEQIRVRLDPAGAPAVIPSEIRVVGNGNVATFKINGNTLFECDDGLVPSPSADIQITIPDAGTYDGEIYYRGVGDSATSSFAKSVDGLTTALKNGLKIQAKELQICNSGTVETITVLTVVSNY